MRTRTIIICLLVIIILYFLQGCASDKPKLLMYGDGTMEDKAFLVDNAHAIKFKVPSGNWAIKSIRYYAIRFGMGQGQGRQIVLTIADDSLQSIYENRVNHGYVDTVVEKWYSMDVSPPLYHPGDIWVILDTNSAQNEGIRIGVDTTVNVSHSGKGRVGGTISDVDGSYDWMIRVELTKLSPQEMEKLRSG